MELIHPEYVMYIYEVNNLRLKAAEKIVHRDALKYHICRYLALDYMLKIGALEYKLLDIRNKVLKNKRILELWEKNNISFDEIDRIIKKEFLENDCKVELMADSVQTAISNSNMHFLTKDEIVEINLYYITLVKDYSPEINSKSPKEEKLLFETIKDKYASGNIKEMKKLEKFEKQELFFDELEVYKFEKERLMTLIKELENQIVEIKNSFPYTERRELQDENLFRRKKDSINKQIIEAQLEFDELEKKIKKLRK